MGAGIARNGQAANSASLPAGVVRAQIGANAETLVSLPFYPFDPDIHAVLGAQLTGATNENAADVVRQWNVGTQSYSSAYKADDTGIGGRDGKWFASFANWSTSALSFWPGESFWIRNNQTVTQDVYLCGLVVLDPTGSVAIAHGLNLMSYPFSSPFPLNDTSLVADGARGGIPGSGADKITDAGTTSEYWLLDVPQHANHGLWVDANTNSSALALQAARGYWYQRVPTNAFEWREPRPYADVFPTDTNPPAITAITVATNRESLTLDLRTSGVLGERLDVYYRDFGVTNVFVASGWSIASTNLATVGRAVTNWTDAATAGRPPLSAIFMRCYLLGRGDVDTDGDGLPDARERFVHGTSPDNGDTDGDLLNDRLEISTHGTDPCDADTDGDGMGDGTEVLQGLNPTQALAYASVPFVEAFETNTVSTGALHGQNGWSVAPTGAAVVETSVVWAGAQAAQLTGASTATGVVSRWLAVAGATSVWSDFHAQPVRRRATGQPSLDVNSAVGFFVNSNGLVTVHDGATTPNHWIPLNAPAPLADSQWVRFTVHEDFEAQRWALWIDGGRVATNLGFAAAAAEFSMVRLTAARKAATYIDALSISTIEPDALDNDKDGLPNAWERLYALNPEDAADAVQDTDHDGLDALAEYEASTCPTNTDTDLDGMCDGVESLHGMDPASADEHTALPLVEDFEVATVVPGDINGQNGWSATAGGWATVQTNMAGAGDAALELRATSPRSAAFHLFAADRQLLAWTDFLARPVRRLVSDDPVLEDRVSVAFFATSNGMLRVHDADGAGWTTLTNHPPISTSTWTRLSVRQDFAAATWSLWLNHTCLVSQLGLKGPAVEPSFVRVTGAKNSSTWVDDLTITAFAASTSISGRVAYEGAMTGTVHVIAATNPAAWTSAYHATLARTGSFTLASVPTCAPYWLRSWRDRDADGERDAWEAQCDGDAIFLLASPTNIWLQLANPTNDVDDDTLPDWWEGQHFGGLDAGMSGDPDADGLDNATEYAAGTDPVRFDTDGDGTGDGTERSLGLDPLDPGSYARGISGTIAYTGGQTGTIHVLAVLTPGGTATNHAARLGGPGVYAMVDLPALTNYWVRAFRDLNGNASNEWWEAAGSLPSNPVWLINHVTAADITLTDRDQDEDGLPDWWEIQESGALLTAAQDDGDGDGLDAAAEVAAGTDPWDVDSDADGVIDGADDNPLLNADSDSDGLPDDWERHWFGGLAQTAVDDPDGDGLRNGVEYALATHPLAFDTTDTTSGVELTVHRPAKQESR